MSSHDFVTADKFVNYGWPFFGPCIRIWLFSGLDLSPRQKVDLATLLQTLQVMLCKKVWERSHTRKRCENAVRTTLQPWRQIKATAEKNCVWFFSDSLRGRLGSTPRSTRLPVDRDRLVRHHCCTEIQDVQYVTKLSLVIDQGNKKSKQPLTC